MRGRKSVGRMECVVFEAFEGEGTSVTSVIERRLPRISA